MTNKKLRALVVETIYDDIYFTIDFQMTISGENFDGPIESQVWRVGHGVVAAGLRQAGIYLT